MIRYSVSEYCGTKTYSPEDGHALYIEIRDEVEAGSQVCVDFEGIKIVTGSFLGAAFGNFYKTLDSDQINTRIKIDNLPSVAAPMFRDVMKQMNVRFAYERSAYLRRLEN